MKNYPVSQQAKQWPKVAVALLLALPVLAQQSYTSNDVTPPTSTAGKLNGVSSGKQVCGGSDGHAILENGNALNTVDLHPVGFASSIAAVREFRLKSKSPDTQKLSDTPTKFHVTVVPNRSFLVIPEVSSEHRAYVPIAWLTPPTIPSNLVRVLLDADLWHFGILTSEMHMAWLRQIGGRLESRYRYSIGIVYNPFPWPTVTDAQRTKIRALAQGVLDARLQFPGSTLADLYGEEAMPPVLRKAHRALDTAVDRLYRSASFETDRDRVEHLFGLYERIVAPLVVAAAPPRTRRRPRFEAS